MEAGELSSRVEPEEGKQKRLCKREIKENYVVSRVKVCHQQGPQVPLCNFSATGLCPCVELSWVKIDILCINCHVQKIYTVNLGVIITIELKGK